MRLMQGETHLRKNAGLGCLDVSQEGSTVGGMERIHPTRIKASPPRRHDGRVARRSRDHALLHRLDRLVVEEHDAAVAVERVCDAWNVALPRLRFHARRSPFTGATERPRTSWVDELGEAEVSLREANGWGELPVSGALRLGRSTTLMTLAHELGHHLVFHLDPVSTPHHGFVWVDRFDDAAGVIADLIEK